MWLPYLGTSPPYQSMTVNQFEIETNTLPPPWIESHKPKNHPETTCFITT